MVLVHSQIYETAPSDIFTTPPVGLLFLKDKTRPSAPVEDQCCPPVVDFRPNNELSMEMTENCLGLVVGVERPY